MEDFCSIFSRYPHIQGIYPSKQAPNIFPMGMVPLGLIFSNMQVGFGAIMHLYPLIWPIVFILCFFFSFHLKTGDDQGEEFWRLENCAVCCSSGPGEGPHTAHFPPSYAQKHHFIPQHWKTTLRKSLGSPEKQHFYLIATTEVKRCEKRPRGRANKYTAKCKIRFGESCKHQVTMPVNSKVLNKQV